MNSAESSQKTGFRVMLLVLFLIAELSFLTFALSSYMGNFVIQNTGEIAFTKVNASSGSAADIQKAVNTVAAAGGGTVYVPAGNWNFSLNAQWGVTVPGGVNIMGMGKNVTVLNAGIYQSSATGDRWFFFVNGGGKSVRISNMSLISLPYDDGNTVGTGGIYVQYANNFRIDNCYIDNNTAAGITVDRSKGVIDHCQINCSFVQYHPDWSWGYGVQMAGNITDDGSNDAEWHSLDTFLGQYDTVNYNFGLAYIEDCSFQNCRHNIASSRGAFYVARYCTFSNPRGGAYMVDIHGKGFAAGQGCEFYSNTIDGGATSGNGQTLRGGASVIYNNTYKNLVVGVQLSADNWDSNLSDPQNVHDTWIWSNAYVNVSTKLSLNVPYVEDTSYFLYARTPLVTYQYPHPLTL